VRKLIIKTSTIGRLVNNFRDIFPYKQEYTPMSINLRATKIMYFVTSKVTGNFKLAFGGDPRELGTLRITKGLWRQIGIISLSNKRLLKQHIRH
jgi:hypothetical protein